jgi:hypothetical protein
MQFKKLLHIFYLLTISFSLFSQEKNNNIDFTVPVDIPIYLSGNFGEIRSTHFHAGIDIKTQGVIGKNIYAVNDGYISRIKISANGYGKTLYINHPDGYTTVYGHLNEFNRTIAKKVKNLQYENREFELNHFPDPSEFPVKKGDLIGYSGNTGSSLGPHLHFEVRETNNQIPLNPLKFDFKVKDNISPVLYNLVVYPVQKNSLVNNSPTKQIFKLKKYTQGYSLVDTSVIEVKGGIGFGIEMYDYLNGSRNRCGVYSLEVFVDSLLIYKHIIDKFSFYETGYVKSHIDYAEKVKSKRTIQKAFIAPNNNLSIYNSSIRRGVYEFKNDSTHQLKILATDVYGNQSELHFKVKGSVISDKEIDQNRPLANLMNWNQENTFETEELSLIIPKNALFDSIYFKYNKTKPDFAAFSNVHHIHSIYTPLYKDYTISIKTIGLPNELKDKAFIAEITDDEMISIGGDVINGHIVSETNTFGSYVVLADTVSPEIKLLTNINEINGKIEFIIKDELTGIKSYNGFIDSNWALFEYDLKNDLLFYTIDPEKIEKGYEHELELFVIDNKDNISTFYTTFYW